MALEYIGPMGTLPNGSRNPLAHIVRAGDTIFFSGLMPKSDDGQLVGGPIDVQTKNVMERLAKMLKMADCEFSDIAKVTVWLTHAEDFVEFNKVYSTFFTDNFPARSAVRSDLLLPEARLEIEAVVYKPINENR